MLVQAATTVVKIVQLDMHKQIKELHTVYLASLGRCKRVWARRIVLPVTKASIKTWWKRQSANHAHQVGKQKMRAARRAVFVLLESSLWPRVNLVRSAPLVTSRQCWMRLLVLSVKEEKLQSQENFVIHVTLAALEVWKVSVTSVLEVSFRMPRVKRVARTASTEKSTEHALCASTARLENEVET